MSDPTGDGLLVVDKPAGWTSHDVVARVRRLAGTRRVGHAGTLDPMATGVLVVGVNRATRLLTYVVGADKEYTATIRLGVATTTDDAEGEVVSRADATGVDPDRLRAAVLALTGDIEQVPSAVSAIKVDGRRAYAMVRAGEEVVLPARPVTVSSFDVLEHRVVAGEQVTDLDVRVVCSSGTYVRALARDLGAALDVGGHLTALRRTRVGGYHLAQARTVEQLEQSGQLEQGLTLLPLAEAVAAALPVHRLTAEEARELSYGRRVPARGATAPTVAGIDPDGALVAVLDVADGSLKPAVVFAPA